MSYQNVFLSSFEEYMNLIVNCAVIFTQIGFWLHVEGENTPEFNGDGYVLSPDRDGSLFNELSSFLDYAAEKNVFVIIVLWNGALMRNDRYKNLVWDESKLNSYIGNVLRVCRKRFEIETLEESLKYN